jgi:hypothetical protein
MDLWSEKILKSIGHLLGKYMDVDPTYSTGSKNNFHFGSFFTVFRVPNFWGRFEALNDVFWARQCLACS